MSGTGRVPGVTRHAMVGRDAEVARLKVMARDAAAGRGGLVLIEGEPGIGKTLLLRTALASAVGLFPRMVTGAAEEFDQRLPFATVHSCLEPLEGGDRRVAEILALVRRGSMEYPVIESVLALVEEWCAASAVAVAVDDMHWADAASLLLLHRLGRIARQLPLLLAATCRSGASRPDVDALTRSWRGHGAVQIMLGPLPEQAVTQLVADLAGGRPGPVLRGLVNGTAGNPLYINELVGGLAQRMRLHSAGEIVDVEPGADRQAVSVTLGLAIAQRLGYLSAQTRELLQVAALLGTAFNLADVAAVLDLPVTHLLGCVREAAEGGVLTALPDRLAFRHPLIRAVLDDELPMSARQALHLQAAQALATRASSDRVAEHLLAAGPAAAPMVPWLAEAADDLVGRAPALAAEVLGQVLETVPPAATEVSIRLRAGHAAALLRSGQPGPAEQAARSALAEPLNPPTEAALRWTLASACASQGAMDRAVHETRVALATGRLTLGEQARFYGLEAQCHLTRSHPADSAAAQQKSISAAQASGDTEAIAYGMAAAARARAWDGWVDEALTCADVSITATEALGPRAGGQLAPQLYRGICLAELDRDADAEQAFEEALRMAERGIGSDFLPFRYNCTAWLRFCQGRWDEALAEIQSGLDFPDAFDIARHLHGLAALIAVHRRDRAALITSLPFLRAPVLPNAPARQSVHAPAWALALAAHSEGRTGEAAAVLGAAWGPDADDDQLRFQRHHLVPDLVVLSMAAGDQATAQRIAASITSYAAKRSAPALQRSARHARALADHDAAGLAEVAEEQQAAERRLFAAQAWEQAAELLAAEGQVRDARAALLGAAASYEALEAGWDLARAETLLRTLGIRRGIRGPRRRPKTGWDALTDAERIVADLVAEGLSNPAIAARLYLSRRTVQGHVSSILGKLGAASRVELATMVIRHGAASS